MRVLRVLLAGVVVVLGACSSSSKSSTPTTPSAVATTTTIGAGPLRVLVTNDDGVSAPGIDALVRALRTVPDTLVTVVAPSKNQSGTGSNLTNGTLTVTDAKTASGYRAKAVHGFPADTIVWAIDQHGIATRPDVVLSGVNDGQNIGKLVNFSGTVGAARAAAERGIPALAISVGVAQHPDFAAGAHAALAWLAQRRAALLGRGTSSASATVTNLNVPSCFTGSPRPVVIVPIAPNTADPVAPVNCISPAPRPTNDVEGFVHGYIVETDNLSLRPAA